MTVPPFPNQPLPTSVKKGYRIDLSKLRPYFTGLLPLFFVAHFGHHVVGSMLNPFMPMIRDDLHLNYTQAGVVISAFAITGGISQLPAGWLSDRFGARLMIAISVSGVASAGLLVGLSHTYFALIAFLVLAALLGGGYHPASTGAFSTIITPDKRGRALGLHLIAGNSAFWIVPLIAAPIAAAWGWHTPYVILTIPIIILGFVLYFLLGRPQYAIQQPQKTTNETHPSARTKIEWKIFILFLILSVSVGMVTQSVAAFYSLYLVDHFGLTAPAAAVLIAVTSAVIAFIAPFGGYLSDKFGGVRVLIITSLVAGPVLYLMKIVPNVAFFVLILLMISGVHMTRMPTSESFLVGNIPLRYRSTMLGIYFFAGAEMTGALTPFIGRLIDTRGFEAVFNITSVSLTAITVVCSILLWRAQRSIHTPGTV